MLWLLALYSILITTSFSQPQYPGSYEGQTVSASNPAGFLEVMADDSSSVSPNTPLDANKSLASSSLPPLDDTSKFFGDVSGTTNQQSQVDVSSETTTAEKPSSDHISFDPMPEPESPAAFNLALIDDGDMPSFPLLDLLQSIPSNINIPNLENPGSTEQKPIDPDPVERGDEQAEKPRYDPEERVENPTPPECGEGRFAMCCNQGPAYAKSTKSQEYVWDKRRLCRLFGTSWEGCHWRQNIFCCACRDKRKDAYGCFSPIYSRDPYYTGYGRTKRPPPPPRYFDRPTVGENVRPRRGRKPKEPPPPPLPQPPESMGPPQVSPPPKPFSTEKTNVIGRPRGGGSCTPEQLHYYLYGGTGLFISPAGPGF